MTGIPSDHLRDTAATLTFHGMAGKTNDIWAMRRICEDLDLDDLTQLEAGFDNARNVVQIIRSRKRARVLRDYSS